MRRLCAALVFAFLPLVETAAERWQTLPPTPAPVATFQSKQLTGNGIHYAIYGHGSPVILLHGGSPILIIGAIRSKPWRRIIASSALTTAVMAARHATRGLPVAI
jgi:hypothetical protein